MLHTLSTLILTALSLVHAQNTNTTVVSQALADAKIVPNVVPNFTMRLPITVVFTDNAGRTFTASAGANLTVNQTSNIPKFILFSDTAAIMGNLYLLAIIDPDAPTPANPRGAFRHFLAADYVSNENVAVAWLLTNQSKTATLTDYVPPKPPAGSPPHRYVVLCYLQNSTGVTPPAGFDAANREDFNITQFVDSVQGNNFTLFSATYFFVGADDPTNTPGSPVATSTARRSSTPKAADVIPLCAVVAWSIMTICALLL